MRVVGAAQTAKHLCLVAVVFPVPHVGESSSIRLFAVRMKLTFIFLLCCSSSVFMAICACVSGQMNCIGAEAGMGSGTTMRWHDRLLRQHSSSAALNMVTANLIEQRFVYHNRSAD